MAGFSRADLHIHTVFSDGTSTPEDLLNYYAVRTEATVIAITDHDTLDGALHAARHASLHADLYSHVDVIVGEEASSSDGHVLGLFLNDWIPPGMDARSTVDAIHDQGGIAIAAHPYTTLMRRSGLVGVGDLIHEIPFDAVETRNSNFTEVLANKKAEKNAGEKARVGSSDGHFLGAVGKCYTEFPGRTAADLRRAILERTTVARGSCYGPLALSKYILSRLRSGGSIFPRRQNFTRESARGGLEIKVHREAGLAVLTLCGRLDALSMPDLKETVTLLEGSRIGVVVDLSALEHLDSAGVTAFVAGLRGAQEHGVGFCLASVSPASARIIEGAGLPGVLRQANSVEEGLRLVASDVKPGDSIESKRMRSQ